MRVMPKPDPLALRFCRALSLDTDGRAMQWRSIMVVGAKASLRDDQVEHAVTHAVAYGLVLVEGGHSVCLTDHGRDLAKG